MLLEATAIIGTFIGVASLSHVYDVHRELKQHKILDTKISIKEHKLKELENELHTRKLNSSVMLTELEIEVLNIYDDSNIRIPTDIIEDLSSMKLSNQKEMIRFIETQRQYWKLENTKKPFIKGVK
jgi:hypothetical protein